MKLITTKDSNQQKLTNAAFSTLPPGSTLNPPAAVRATSPVAPWKTLHWTWNKKWNASLFHRLHVYKNLLKEIPITLSSLLNWQKSFSLFSVQIEAQTQARISYYTRDRSWIPNHILRSNCLMLFQSQLKAISAPYILSWQMNHLLLNEDAKTKTRQYYLFLKRNNKTIINITDHFFTK